MKVALINFGHAPPGLVRSVWRGLPAPWVPDCIEQSDNNLTAMMDQTRLQADALRVLELIPSDMERFWVGLVSVDLMFAPLAYVCGVAPLGGRRALVSWARLKEGLTLDSSQFVDRVVKEIAHELGHAGGLIHCPVHDCVMHASLRPDEMDLKRSTYCPSCWTTLTQR